jgi:hypothetical protein
VLCAGCCSGQEGGEGQVEDVLAEGRRLSGALTMRVWGVFGLFGRRCGVDCVERGLRVHACSAGRNEVGGNFSRVMDPFVGSFVVAFADFRVR